jgi:hypothetical protein
MGKILAKLANANWTDWDVILVIVLCAYRTSYKVTTQYTLFELVYNTQQIMSVEFAIPTKRICNLPW